MAHDVGSCVSGASSMCSESLDLFKFWQICDNISETVQDKDVVAMEE